MTDPYQSDRTILSVAQLNRQARQLLETHLPLLWVEGELSNFVQPSSGHWYFSLKDDQAQVRCAMFRNRNQRVAFQPENGGQVVVRCRVSLYEGRGDYQLIVEHMEEAGHGLLQKRFEALKAQLLAEGLFDPSHKQPLPELPSRIGVVTSPTGAAIQDILTVLQRRFPAIEVSIYPTQVQGEMAAAQIAEAIAWANQQQRCEALIVGRGGGSQEDLWPFNEEVVARAIFQSRIPIVTAVGHETDITIADFVADQRAPTPSAAAEILSPDAEEMLATFQGYRDLLQQQLSRILNAKAQQLDALRSRLRHPKERLRENAQRLDQLEIRLQQANAANVARVSYRITNLANRLTSQHPSKQLNRLQTLSEDLEQRLTRATQHTLQCKQQQWRETSQLLNAVSPLNTLERGYAIVLNNQQQAIKSVTQVAVDDTVSTRLSDGTIHCKVINEPS